MRPWFAKEVIGNPDCPLIHRWTLIHVGVAKLMVHHFLPNARDRNEHDHPRSFWTLVLRGRYLDIQRVREDYVIHEVMKAGRLRFRPAEHAHKTVTEHEGAWTLVLMLRKRRDWGFFTEMGWLSWRMYEKVFGHGMRCE